MFHPVHYAKSWLETIKPYPYPYLCALHPNYRLVSKSVARFLYAFDMRIVGEHTLPIEKLKTHYRHEVNYDGALPIDPKTKRVDRCILNFPLLETAQIYLDRGREACLRNWKDLPYYRLRAYELRLGFKWDRLRLPHRLPLYPTEESIYSRIESFFTLIDILKTDGYLGGRYRKEYVTATEIPFEQSRFGRELHQEPYEIFGGNHRTSALAALGESTIKVLLLKDVYRGPRMLPEVLDPFWNDQDASSKQARITPTQSSLGV